jgi:hypothetical protein
VKSTKEPKERTKSSAKPRKSKQAVAEPAPEMAAASLAQPPAVASAHPLNESGNGNGTMAPSPAALEAVNGTAEMSSAAEPVAEFDPPRELIEVRAYELFAQRGYVHGHQEEDWLAAEHELKSRHRNV